MNRVTHLDCYFKEAPVLLFRAINFYLLSCGGGGWLFGLSSTSQYVGVLSPFILLYAHCVCRPAGVPLKFTPEKRWRHETQYF
jgi:hypothetical protein